MFVMFVNKENGVGSSDLRKVKNLFKPEGKNSVLKPLKCHNLGETKPASQILYPHALELLNYCVPPTHPPILYLLLPSRFSPNLVSHKRSRLCQCIAPPPQGP